MTNCSRMTTESGGMEGDFDTRVQRKAEQRLEACWDAVNGEVGGEVIGAAPFCGCTTCIVREVLEVCWDEMAGEAEARAVEHVVASLRDRHQGALAQLRREGDAVRVLPPPQ